MVRLCSAARFRSTTRTQPLAQFSKVRAQLDPYALDTYFAHPRWTEPHAVRRALATVRPLPDDPALALAALRDIHMLMCALERDRPGRTLPEHPWLEPLLIHLGDLGSARPLHRGQRCSCAIQCMYVRTH